LKKLLGASLLAALVVGAIGLALAYRNLQPAAPPAARPGVGEATGLLGPVGFRIGVSQVDRDFKPVAAPAPAQSQHYISLRVTFYNESESQQRADPDSFRLRDPQGAVRRPSVFADPAGPCGLWRMADLHPRGKASESARDASAQQIGPLFGPVRLCFEVAGDPAGRLVLLWDPDTGLLASGPVQLVLA